MPTYNSAILRTGTLGTDQDALVPEPMVQDVIAEATKSSTVLQACRLQQMAAGTLRQPVLSTKAVATWRSSDTGLAESTDLEWENVDLVAESLVVYVPIPRDYLDDTVTDVWGQVRAEVGEAFAKALDAACLFGTSAPTTFGNSVYEVANAVNNTVQSGTGDDLGADIGSAAELLAEQGYNVNGFIAKPGFGWTLRNQRSADGQLVFDGSLQNEGPVQRLYGFPLLVCDNGGFDSTSAELLMGDWNKAIVGIRSDMTMEMSTEAIVQDGAGNIVYNSFQSHLAILKVHARYAFATAKPVTALEDSALQRAPFAVLTPGT